MSAMKEIFADLAEAHESGVNIKDYRALISALGASAAGHYLRDHYTEETWAVEAENFLTLMGTGDKVLERCCTLLEKAMRDGCKEAMELARFFMSSNVPASLAFQKIVQELEINKQFAAKIKELYSAPSSSDDDPK